ncbi:hypothetical protein OHA21_14095 [Actinoplanes sp. NBC_00393]|uniref:hypothetical protein n=1 Tax=Actinoplanes sp. NBC_00393 TaxID=2975953 RepID=UPI002E2517D9
MPHLTVHATETDLKGREEQLITGLTDAVIAVYGPWARDIAVVKLVGVPAGRWGIGGKPATNPAPTITFGIKEEAFSHPGVIDRLAAGVTDAITNILGEQTREAITVDFIGTLPGRTAIGGVITPR